MNTLKALSVLALLASISFSSNALASVDDEDAGQWVGYDDIIRDLSGNSGSSRAKFEPDPFATVMIHGGVGMATTFGQVKAGNETIHMNQSGVQAALGIDLFSEHWFAEATARTFSETKYSQSSVALKEFDLKVYYKDRFSKNMGFRMGGGLAARYMTAMSKGIRFASTTPASVGVVGLEYYLNKNISAGAEMGIRSALISETIDKNSADAIIRVDAHF